MRIKLYEITPAWEAIQNTLLESCGDLTPEIEAQMTALLGASKDKLEAAGYVKRNLEIHADLARAQAGVFQENAAACMGMVKTFEGAADRLGAMMAPALKVTGTIKTVAGTLYATRRVNYAITLKPGVDIKSLPREFWRQADPELNKKPLQDLAKLHPVTEEQLEFVTGGEFKPKDIERIHHDLAVTDADLEVLAKDDLTFEQQSILDAIRAGSKVPTEIIAVRSESLTTALRTAPASKAAPEPAPAPDLKSVPIHVALLDEVPPAAPALTKFIDPLGDF